MNEQSPATEAEQSPMTPTAAWGAVEFRRLLEKLPAGAYTCDPQGLITYYNQHAVQLWGRAPKLNDVTDRFCGSFRLFASDSGAAIDHDHCWMALALRHNKEYNGHEIVVERPDGQRLTALAYANPFRDESGKLAGAVNVLVDISDRKRVEEALREADRSKDEFLATLAHELRNPLAPVRSAVEILQMRSGDVSSEDSKWAVDVIDRQVTQMSRLIDDLLDISRITRNRLEMRKQRVELADVVHAAIETSRPLIESARHTLTTTFPDEPLAVDADPTRLAQAVSNLLNNAAKYTENGGRIWLTVSRQDCEAVVSVRDTGVGIPVEMLPRVFDMFTQGSQHPRHSAGGLGIGLTLVKRLVELHGGTIRARSDGPGTGSEFIMRLPLATSEIPTSSRTHSGNGDGRVAPATSSLRILVVDDNRDAVRCLARLLQLTGHEVRVAGDGAEAIAVASEFRPDVMLLDIGMPHMNGYDAARHVKQQPWGKDVVLVAVTGWGQDADRVRSREAGFDHHLVKPLDPAALMQLLASIARRESVAD